MWLEDVFSCCKLYGMFLFGVFVCLLRVAVHSYPTSLLPGEPHFGCLYALTFGRGLVPAGNKVMPAQLKSCAPACSDVVMCSPVIIPDDDSQQRCRGTKRFKARDIFMQVHSYEIFPVYACLFRARRKSR